MKSYFCRFHRCFIIGEDSLNAHVDFWLKKTEKCEIEEVK